MLQPSSKLPWTCPGHSLRGPAHDLKEEEVTGHPLRSDSVGGTAGGRTIVPTISDTRKDVNGGLIPLLHDPNRILTKEEYVNHSYRNEEEDTAVVIAAKSNQVNQVNSATENPVADATKNMKEDTDQNNTGNHEGTPVGPNFIWDTAVIWPVQQQGLQKISASNGARMY